ncbi:MAG: hypothetical protein CYPHOPRED_001460 [Cyphobasidiales sp. Tagirdzhanova-0007]|nr:MAG: hypothetical protein CYPHOPRED_001460 [Cyphobasidiales sp. Tagirdzhanova-0007]
MQLPLYRRNIMGTAIDQDSDYASTSSARQTGHVEGDETEDLHHLLKTVLAAHPNIEGVSVGAILSNYQRIRVEHVCARLGLQSLSFLWQFDQLQLLEDMYAAGMDSVIIKVAGAGLGERHLGQNVCCKSMRDELEKLQAKWGLHPAGEGGEYETFTVDCPLFHNRVKLLQTQSVVLSSGSNRDEMGTVAYLRLKEAKLVQKAPLNFQLWDIIRVPDLLDEQAKVILNSIQDSQQSVQSSDGTTDEPQAASAGKEALEASFGNWLGIGEVTCPSSSVEAEVKGCLRLLQEKLRAHELGLTSLAHVNIYLSSMTLFFRVNNTYNVFFGPSPPSRACVVARLPLGTHIKMDGVVYKASPRYKPRIALHVQGLSYWAPANIGPYSQAVIAGERMFVAGQIGLQPRDLTLSSPPSFAMEAVLSAQHTRRIVKAMQEGTGGGFQGWMESCICWISGPTSTFVNKRDQARIAWLQWSERPGVPFLIVQTPELPKQAQVEWQITWQTGRSHLREEAEDEITDLTCLTSESVLATKNLPYFRHTSLSCGTSHVSVLLPVNTTAGAQNLSSSPWLNKAFSVRAFHTACKPYSEVYNAAADVFGRAPPLTTIQVLKIATEDLDELDLAYLAFSYF